MSTTVTECRPSTETLRAIEQGRAAWEASCREHGRADEWDRQLIDSAIRAFVRQGQPFSANDIRDRIPGVRKALIGRRFVAAQNHGLLESIGYTPSTLPSTRGAVVQVYLPLGAVNLGSAS